MPVSRDQTAAIARRLGWLGTPEGLLNGIAAMFLACGQNVASGG